jgi:hypothetical protein
MFGKDDMLGRRTVVALLALGAVARHVTEATTFTKELADVHTGKTCWVDKQE